MTSCNRCVAYDECFASKLNGGELVEMASHVNQKKYEKGDVLFTEKEQGKYFFMVCMAALRQSVTTFQEKV